MCQVIIENSINPIKELMQMWKLLKFWKWPSIVKGFFRIEETTKLVVRPAHHTNIIVYHVLALILAIIFISLMFIINWVAGVISFIVIFGLVWYSLYRRLPVFRLSEQYAAFVMLFGKPVSLIWLGSGKVALLNEDEVSGSDTLLRLEEVYIADSVREEDKLVNAMIKDAENGKNEADQYFTGQKPVFYKIRETIRKAKKKALITIPVKKEKAAGADLSDFSTGEMKSEVREFTPDKIFYEFEGTEYTLQSIIDRKTTQGPEFPKNFPDDFFDTVTGGFYVKGGPEEKEHLPANIDEVLDEEVTKDHQKAHIIGRDRSVNQISGGLFFTGLWPFFSVHTYRFRWSSQETDGSPRDQNLILNNVYHGDDQYLFRIDHVEVMDMLQVTLFVLVTLRIVNPYHALFSAQKWLEMVSGIIRQNFRTIVGGMSIDEVRVSKASISQTLSAIVMARICDPKGAKLQRRYGALIHQVELADIKPEDISESNPLALPFIARQKAAAKRTEGKAQRDYAESVGEGEARRLALEGAGRADAIRKEIKAVEENPAIAIPLAYVRGLEKVGAGAGNTVLVGGDILRALETLGSNTLKRIITRGGE